MSNEWRNDLPPKEGYYEAKFGADDTPQVIYLHPFKAGEIAGIDEDFISWGWDENDDPESVEVECGRGDFWWREIQPTPRAPDAANVCRVVKHVYVDGVCAECGSPEPQRR